MDYQKLWKLVSVLVSKTTDGKIAWEPSSLRGGFQVSLQNFSVMITQEYEDDNPIVKISLYNKEGKMIETATDSDLNGQAPDPYQTMRGLYDNARRIAYGVDKALDEIIGELDDAPPF